MKKHMFGVIAMALIAGNLYAGGPADLSVGWGRAMTPGDPVADLPANFGAYFTEISGITNLSQDIEILGEDITFTLSVEAANSSIIPGDGTGLINSRSTGEDICILGGSSDIRTDARDPGSADDEGLRLTLSVSGGGVTNLTDVSMDFVRIRRFADSGSLGQVTLYDGINRTGNSTIAQNTSTNFLGDFVYTEHPVLTNANTYVVSNLTALSSSNAGGIGDGSWVLEMYATDTLTNSIFALGDVKVNFSLADYGNSAPVADDPSVSTPVNTPLVITLTATDLELDPLTFAILDNPTSGSVTGSTPNVTYIPNTDFTGSDSFTFTADDGEFSSTGTVSITVTPDYQYVAFGEDYYPEGGVEWNWETAGTNVNTHTANRITFTVTFTGANDSLADDTVNNRTTGNDICISGGGSGLRIDPRGTGDASDDEGLRMTISVSGEGAASLTSIALDELILRRFSAGTEIVSYYDGANGTGNEYTSTTGNTVPASELFTTGGLTSLDLTNVGGAGDGSWVLEFWARTDGQDFALGDIKLAYTLGSVGSAYDTWAGSWGVDIGDAANDPEPDGMDNLLEYAFGGNPTTDDAADKIPATSVSEDGAWFTHVHIERIGDDTLTYDLKLNENLTDANGWTANGITPAGEAISGDFKTVTNRTDIGTAEFLRLTVEQN